MAALQLLPAAFLVVLFSLLVATECMSTGKSGDSEADSSVTSYSTVVIHHPQGKKSSKEPEESRSQTYYKVKRVKTSTEQPKIQGDFRPSHYYPESNSGESYKSMESAQTSVNSKQMEQQDSESKQETEIRKAKFKNEDRITEETTWKNNFRPRQRYQGRKQHAVDSSQEPEPRKEAKQSGEESQENLEILRHNHKTKNEDKSKRPSQQEYRPNFDGRSLLSNPLYQYPNKPNKIIYPIEIPFKDLEYIKDHAQNPLTPLMTEDLIETLLSQQPQTFDTKNSELKKKSKSQNFKVGYSIGFGGEDVIVGKPKDISLHINGKNSIWKSLPNGVEMSAEQDKKNALEQKIADSALKASDSVLKKDVYYMNNYKQDNTVPTTGRSTFDHAQAMTHSNPFDFSNAVDPRWYQQQEAAFDMTGLYQSLGYPSPLPVYIPGPQNSGSMVPALVIPIHSLPPTSWPSEGHALQPQQLHSQQLHPHQLHPQQFQPQHLQLQTATHQPHHLHPASSNHLQLQPSAHQALQQQIPDRDPFQLNSIGHQSIQLQSATNEPFHLVPIQFAQFVQMSPQTQHQQHVQAIPVAVQSKAQVQQIQPTMQQYHRARTPKVRDSIKQGTFESTPIVVATTPSDQVKLQEELNAILADEMKRKNHRHPAVGLRPPSHPL